MPYKTKVGTISPALIWGYDHVPKGYLRWLDTKNDAQGNPLQRPPLGGADEMPGWLPSSPTAWPFVSRTPPPQGVLAFLSEYTTPASDDIDGDGMYNAWEACYEFNFRDASDGDIVIAVPRNRKEDLIKRVVALPGDRIAVVNGQIVLNGKPVPQGSYLNQIVGTCLEFIAEGHPVTVMPMENVIGTQEAADMLKVSRPFMVKLLDSKALPSRKVGVQRRVNIQDVLAYKEREKAARIKVLQELAAEGQRLNLGE